MNHLVAATEMYSFMRLYTLICSLLLHIELIWSLTPSFPRNSAQLCPLDQSFALLQLKNVFGIDSSASFSVCDENAGTTSFPKTDSWKKGTDCCLWDGVTCDESTRNVIGIDLSCSWLQGKIPFNSSLFKLSHLKRLNLANNDFEGTAISPDFRSLVSLTHLNLSYSNFAGVVPPEISHLSKMVSLDLSYNDRITLDKHIVETLSKNLTRLQGLFLGNLDMSLLLPGYFRNLSSSLVSLSLRSCAMQGDFPLSIFHLPRLEILDISLNQDLTGTLPISNWSSPLRLFDLSFTGFSGEVPDSIGNLKSLREVNLQSCSFTGSLPNSLWNLTQITHLDLSSNKFTGHVPPSLANLQHLTLLDLSFNHFQGRIPDVFTNLRKASSLSFVNNSFSGPLPFSVFKLSKLSTLEFSDNSLEGPLPGNVTGLSDLTGLYLTGNKLSGTLPSWLFNLSSLIWLDLGKNQFTGTIPEFESKSLEYIYLDQNMLQGEIPKSLFELANLTDLFLSSNNLSGTLELKLVSKLKNLGRISLSNNNLSIITTNHSVTSTWPKIKLLMLSSCSMTEFPDFFKTQDELAYLDLSNNNIHGEIPKWMSNVGKDSLIWLDLSRNHLTGILEHIPWRGLEVLDLHSNMLQGLVPIPPADLTYFSVSENNFSGKVSSLICNASSLQILDLSHNSLSGKIPSCLGNLSTSLSVLNLRMNSFGGKIPATYAEDCKLSNLNLQGNQLEGPLPSSLVNCRELEVLDLGHNMLNDVFPKWLETLPMLRVLVIRSNKLHGPSPDFAANYSFPNLQVLDISNNALIGRLPNLQNLGAMANVDDREGALKYLGTTNYSYDYSIVLSVKGSTTEMQKIFHVFTSIDLSNNTFEGEIPIDVGMLISLKGLNLSHNILSGHIAQSLRNLKNLEWLDLSSNKLVGAIPKQLVDITSLAILNLSNNQLAGPIPGGKQFNTFTVDSYRGNLGLCGFPLPKKCGEEEPKGPISSMEEDNSSFLDYGFGWQAVSIGYGCGVVFGVVMGYIMFRCRKPRWLLVIIEDKFVLGQRKTQNSSRIRVRNYRKFC